MPLISICPKTKMLSGQKPESIENRIPPVLPATLERFPLTGIANLTVTARRAMTGCVVAFPVKVKTLRCVRSPPKLT